MAHTAEQRNEYRAKKVSEGWCQMCLCRIPEAGRKTCEPCLEKCRIRNRENYEKKYKSLKTAKYHKAKADGVCTYCFSAPSVPGRSRCRECSRKNVHRAMKKKEERAIEGYCWRCCHRRAVRVYAGNPHCQKCIEGERSRSRRESAERVKDKSRCSSCGVKLGEFNTLTNRAYCERCCDAGARRMRDRRLLV